MLSLWGSLQLLGKGAKSLSFTEYWAQYHIVDFKVYYASGLRASRGSVVGNYFLIATTNLYT